MDQIKQEESMKEFSQIRKNQYLLRIAFIPALVIIALVPEKPDFFFYGISNLTLLIIAIILIFGGVIFSRINWRCPSCSEYLGKSRRINFCPKCGVKLQEK